MRDDSTMAVRSRSFDSTSLALLWRRIGLRRREDFHLHAGAIPRQYRLAAALTGVAILIPSLLALLIPCLLAAVHLIVK